MKFYVNGVSGDTAYLGNELISNFVNSSVSIVDYDGNSYTIVNIGSQKWLGQNLKTTHLNDGTSLTYLTSGSTSVSGYSWYDNDISYKNIYGALYSGNAALNSKIAPSGCHVPSIDDFSELYEYKSTTGELKTVDYWDGVLPNTNSTNFSSVPHGTLWSTGEFHYIGQSGMLWTSKEYDSIIQFYIGCSYATATLAYGMFFKSQSVAIRCLVDQTLDKPTVTTITATGVTSTSVKVTISITSTTDITLKGVCYSMYNANEDWTHPTLLDDYTISVSGGSPIDVTVSGLNPNINYYFRGFSKNTDGLSYGSSILYRTNS